MYSYFFNSELKEGDKKKLLTPLGYDAEKNTIASNSNHRDYLWLRIILVILALLKE